MSENIQTNLELNISPKKIRDRKGLFQVTIVNKQNLTNTYQLKASDTEGMCNYNFNVNTVTIPAGISASVKLTVSFKKIHFAGAPKVCNFTVTSSDSAGEIKKTEGQLESPPLLPIWALVTGGLLVVAIIAVVVVLASGGDNSNPPLSDKPAMTTSTTSGTTKSTATSSSTTPPSTTSTSALTTTSTSTTTKTTTTTTNTTTTTTPATTVTIPSIAGQWQWILTVTLATGACAGEEGLQSPRNVQITQNGKILTMSGFLGSNPSISLSGEITFDDSAKQWIVKFSGNYPEDQGTTTTNYILVLNNTFDEMAGDENWDWVGGDGSCPGSKSTVVAKKLS
jgi:hypothetical protein